MKIFNKNEWKKVKLGDVFDLQMGKTPLRENKLYWDKGEYNWISISDMNFSEKYISSTKEKITELAVKKSGIKIIPKNTVIMSFKLSIGKVKVVNEDIYSNEAIMAFIPKTNNFIDENFLYYSLKGVRWNEGINKAVKGLTLNKSLISQKEIFLPNLAIQKEIASNLDSIADFLDLRRKQLNFLKELNKSLFISMFFSNNKNFERKKLKDNVIEMFIGPFGSDLKNEVFVEKERGYCVVYEQKHAIKKRIDDEIRYIPKEKYEVLKRFRVDAGDIIVSCRGTIGKIFVLPSNSNFGIIHPSLMKIKLKKEKYNNTFFEKLLEKYMQENLYSTQGSSIKMGITAKKLGEEYFILPSIELQNKFAERIEKIEKLKFTIMTIILKAYKTLKKKGVEKI